MLRRTTTFLLVGAAAVAMSGTSAAQTTLAAPDTHNHFIANLNSYKGPISAGFNVLDIGPSEASKLPAGVRGLVWLGEKCPTKPNASFKRTVHRLAKSPKVFGYYLSDEPHIGDCPGGPAALRAKADFINRVSNGRQKSFIVLDDSYAAFRPRRSHVSMIGIDAYPCSTSHPRCDMSVIRSHYHAARNGGIARSRIVPVYQAFGQENTSSHYYNLPTARQLRRILAQWAKLTPHPPMDYAYGWHNQDSANPTLVDAPALQRVFRTTLP